MPGTFRLALAGSGGTVSMAAGGASTDAASRALTSNRVRPMAPLARAATPNVSELPMKRRRDQSGISAVGAWRSS